MTKLAVLEQHLAVRAAALPACHMLKRRGIVSIPITQQSAGHAMAQVYPMVYGAQPATGQAKLFFRGF